MLETEIDSIIRLTKSAFPNGAPPTEYELTCWYADSDIVQAKIAQFYLGKTWRDVTFSTEPDDLCMRQSDTLGLIGTVFVYYLPALLINTLSSYNQHRKRKIAPAL
jgi:hypothetical protein